MINSHPQLDKVTQLMNGFQYPWFIAGGWSIDLGIGRITRKHEDMDICVFREHGAEVLAYFSDWQIEVAIPKESRLEPVRSKEDIRFPRYGIHLNKGTEFIEVMLTDKNADEVVFRRDPEIRMDIQEFIRVDSLGRQYIAPEMQLLYKAKEGRPKDNHDFSVALPHMTPGQKAWFIKALAKHHPGSPWIGNLSSHSLGKQN